MKERLTHMRLIKKYEACYFEIKTRIESSYHCFMYHVYYSFCCLGTFFIIGFSSSTRACAGAAKMFLRTKISLVFISLSFVSSVGTTHEKVLSRLGSPSSPACKIYMCTRIACGSGRKHENKRARINNF